MLTFPKKYKKDSLYERKEHLDSHDTNSDSINKEDLRKILKDELIKLNERSVF